MIGRELNCTPTEAKARTLPNEFYSYIEFWKTHPPLEDHLNICLAQISQMLVNVNLGKGQRPKKLDTFIIDYKKAILPTKKELAKKIHTVFGALSGGKIK